MSGRGDTFARPSRLLVSMKDARKTDQFPGLESALSSYRARLQGLVDRCRALRVRTIFMTQPTLWRRDAERQTEDLLWFGETSDGTYLTANKLHEGLEAYNSVLVSVSRETGSECVDLRPMSGVEEFFYDDCHFTERGAAEVAHRLAPVLVRDRSADR